MADLHFELKIDQHGNIEPIDDKDDNLRAVIEMVKESLTEEEQLRLIQALATEVKK